MSRTKYSPEKQKAIMAIFIEATREIIDEEGAKTVSIRNVSARAGYSSATLYLYFKDINQLIAMASISILRDYIADIATNMQTFESRRDQYVYTWQAFCEHSYRRPTVFMRLFFNENADKLDDIVKKYYSIFPNELEEISSTALAMLMRGNLYERNYAILKAYTDEAGISAKEARLINDMTVCFYRKYLEEACENDRPDEEFLDRITKETLEGVNYLLDRAVPSGAASSTL